MGMTTPLQAQQSSSEDAPYAPRQFSRSELIDFGTYDETPIEFPWAIEEVEEIPVYSRIDFKHRVDASYRTISQYFNRAYRKQTPTVTLKGHVSPTSSPLKLKVYGHAKSDDGERFTLGHSKLMRKFYVDLMREGGDVYLVFRNASYTQIFGGMVPNRSPFKPVRAEPVELR